MVDIDTRQIDKILRRYDEMIVSCLAACVAFDKEQDAVLEVFDRRRTMFKSPAHVAAMMLDPEFRDHTLVDDAEMQQGLTSALVQFRYPKSSDQHKEVLTAIDKFLVKEPPFDDVVMDRAARSYNHSATDVDNDLEDRYPDGDDDDGVGGDDRGDGGDRPRPRSTRGDGDRGAGEAARDYRDEGNAGAGTGAGGSRYEDGDRVGNNIGARGDGHGDGDDRAGRCAAGSTREDTDRGITAVDINHRAASDDDGDGGDDDGLGLLQGGGLKRLRRGPRERDTIASRVRRRRGGASAIPRPRVPATAQIPVSEDFFSDDAREEWIEQADGNGPLEGSGPLMCHLETEGDNIDDAVMQAEVSAAPLHPLTSAGGQESTAVTSDTR
ncbi:hypothetical protein CBR_g50054 [Chara braunii]|uniref:Uncharacterized protein n=1 Tax=Chara braunii TaxID=69332 RepID=A0A388M5V2_CHABU|nr:hypothetical protein CBR_g50054 [Chara braunii]|eukprot:GBG89964.1 hypothetical protein CBR_g50054 [Chara braunii]